jgi:multiple sugar transport system substrate-binding protein
VKRKLIAAIASAALASSSLSALTELEFWNAWGGEEGKKLDQMIERYNASQADVKVRSVYAPIGMGEKTMATLSGTSVPDLMTVWDWMVVPLGYRGQVLDLGPYLAKAGIGEKDYVKGVWGYGAYKGKKYGVPTTLNMTLFSWSKKAFAEAGLDPEKPPRSLAELDAYTDKLTKYDAKGNLKRIGFDPTNSHIYMYIFGGELVDPKSGAITANDPNNVKAYEWLVSYYKKFDIQKKRVFMAGWGELYSALNPFYRGEIAMKEFDQWEILALKLNSKKPFEYGVAGFPSPPGGRTNVAFVSGSAWVIPTASKHKDEAFAFLKWLTAPAQAAEFAAGLYNIPPVKAALESPAFKAIVDPRLALYLEVLDKGFVYTFPQLPIGQAYLAYLTEALQDVQQGKKGAKEALDWVQAKVTEELKNQK